MFGRIRTRSLSVAAAVAIWSAATPALAEQFTFEDVPVGYYPSTLEIADGGLTMTVTPEGNPSGYVIVLSDGVGVPSLGNRSVIGSELSYLDVGRFSPLRFTFSSPIGAIAFAFGDSGGDNDSPVTIQAFNAANVSLGTLSETYPFGLETGKTLAGNFPGASYFIVSSGSESGNPNSIFWEITSVTPVPEPTAVALLSFGAAVLIASRRRQRSTGQ